MDSWAWAAQFPGTPPNCPWPQYVFSEAFNNSGLNLMQLVKLYKTYWREKPLKAQAPYFIIMIITLLWIKVGKPIMYPWIQEQGL